jgi:hypothetical protein
LFLSLRADIFSLSQRRCPNKTLGSYLRYSFLLSIFFLFFFDLHLSPSPADTCSLEKLYLRFSGPLDARELSAAIQRNTSLTSLELPFGKHELSLSLSPCYLYLSVSIAVLPLSLNLYHVPLSVLLTFSSVSISSEGADLLLPAVQKHTALTALSLPPNAESVLGPNFTKIGTPLFLILFSSCFGLYLFPSPRSSPTLSSSSPLSLSLRLSTSSNSFPL